MPTLEELRPQLELSIQQSEAGRELLRVVETLKDLAFNADGLEGPAAELGLTVKRSERLNRNQAVGLFAQPALLNAAFSAEVLVEKHNSEVIELPGGRHVVLRVREHHTPQVRSLDEVSDNIATRLTESAARQAVSARAESILSQLQRGGSVESIALEAGFDWQVELGAQRTGTAVPPSLLTRAFSLPAPEAGQSAFEFVMDDNGDALVFELFRVTSGELAGLTPLQRQQLIQGAVGESARLLDLEYQQGLRERADITVL
jgi:peptidyl-prolyl cis-trans isomerase D